MNGLRSRPELYDVPSHADALACVSYRYVCVGVRRVCSLPWGLRLNGVTKSWSGPIQVMAHFKSRASKSLNEIRGNQKAADTNVL